MNAKSIALFVSTLMIVCSCKTIEEAKDVKQLSNLKQAANQGDWGKIAGTAVECEITTVDCVQSHLIKGDACYRLAKQNANDVDTKNYQCAADNLEPAMQAVKNFSDVGQSPQQGAQYYENWCESLRMLRGQQTSNDAAATINAKLQTCAGKFAGLQTPPPTIAIYFLNNAGLADVRFHFDAPDACQKLSRLHASEKAALQQTTEPQATALHQRLIADIDGIAQAKSCTQ